MNKTVRTTGLSAALLLALLGCGSSTSNPFGQLDGAQNAAISDACQCFTALEYSNAAECEAALEDSYTATERACLEEVYRTYNAELAPNTACRLAALDVGVDCLNDVVDCNATGVQTCIGDVGDAFTECPAIPQAVEDALDACTP
ncbi:MAG: hypothetical protein KC593_12680 [Myxococcales bacterium]|nr:hypothetical protein [Myxococcales bacterium]MCB9628611.1 hypothetical protein [Sandaracinaceae bacterium]